MHNRQADGSSDRRWIVILENGEHAGTLGRARDPSETEIRSVEEALKAKNAAGWLAIMSGSIHGAEIPEVVEVRPLAGPRRPFADAAADLRRRLEEDRRRG